MSKFFMPEETPARRLELLSDNADSIEERSYYVDLDQNALDAKRETLTGNIIIIAEADEKLQAAKDEYKAIAKPLIGENKILVAEVRMRREKRSGQIFNIADYETKMMNSYDESGELIGSRRLKTEEMQKRMAFLHGGQSGKTAEQ